MAQKEAKARKGDTKKKKTRSTKETKSKRLEHSLSKKIIKEPELFPEGMFPDPLQKFIDQEQQEFDDFLNQYLNPLNLKLGPYEVNQ